MKHLNTMEQQIALEDSQKAKESRSYHILTEQKEKELMARAEIDALIAQGY